jgi:hypothetical protein
VNSVHDPTDYEPAQIALRLRGNAVVRALGDVARPEDLVAGGGEPLDTSLAAPLDLTAVMSGPGATLTWRRPASGDYAAAVDEREMNDRPAQAQEVPPNAVVTGSVQSSETGAPGIWDDVEDWYAFTLEEQESISIDLTVGRVDLDVLLYGWNGLFLGFPIAATGNGDGVNEHLRATLPRGTYVIGVSAYDSPPVPETVYRLKVAPTRLRPHYNVYSGVGTVVPSPETFLAAVPLDPALLFVAKSAPGSVYVVTAVIGGVQSAPSAPVFVGDCEHGPTVARAVVRIKNGVVNVKVTGAGFTVGTRVLVDSVEIPATAKVNKAGTTLSIKGTLGGVAVGQVVTVALFEPLPADADGGCALAVATVR